MDNGDDPTNRSPVPSGHYPIPGHTRQSALSKVGLYISYHSLNVIRLRRNVF